MSAPDNPAAFPGPGPRIGTDEANGFPIWADPLPGMTLRDWFAGQAVNGSLVAIDGQEISRAECVTLAREAYQLADAMLAERMKGTGQ